MPSEEHELLAERLPGNHALLRDACGLELSTLSQAQRVVQVRLVRMVVALPYQIPVAGVASTG